MYWISQLPLLICNHLLKKGTWEHKLRQAEIERTEGSRWKENHQNDDDPPISHHISHFLPPEELAKFMQRQKVKVVGAILYVVLSKCLYVKQRVNNSYLLMVSVFTNYYFSFLASLPSLLFLFSLPLLSKPMSPGDVKRWTSGHEWEPGFQVRRWQQGIPAASEDGLEGRRRAGGHGPGHCCPHSQVRLY